MAKRLTTKQYMERLPEDCGIEPVDEIMPQKYKTKWVCEKGHTFEKRVSNMISHPFCPVCKPCNNNKRYTLEDVVIIYEQHGYEFIDSEYQGSKHRHNTKCISCGHISGKKLNHLLSGKSGCTNCGNVKKITQARMDAILTERGYTSWSGAVENGHSVLRIFCERSPIAHIFTMSCRDLLSGNNCPYCSDRFRKDAKYVNTAFGWHNLPYKVVGDYLGSHTTQDYQCTVCNTVFTGTFKAIKSGRRACPECYPTQQGKARNQNGHHILYYLRVRAEDGLLYKIGVTGRSVNERFRLIDLNKIDILQEFHFDTGNEAYRKERELLLKYADFRYQGDPILSSGNTELFYTDVLGLDKSNLDTQPKAS